MKSGTSIFVDEFDDDIEPPSGPSGPSTYGGTPSSADAESSGMLNLNSDDAIISDDPSMDIFASLADNAYFFNSGSGGSLEGRFRFINGFETNTGFIITIHDTPLSELESSSLWIQKETSGRIFAYFDRWLSDTDTAIISKTDITDFLTVTSYITLRMDISPANVVTASLDFGSDDTFDLTMPGSYTLTFPGETKHTGAFGAFEDLNTACTLNMETSFAGGVLNMSFELGVQEPVTWNVYLSVFDVLVPLWSIPLPALDPPISVPISIPGFPSLGEIGVLTTLTTADGIICSGWKTVDTGQ